MLRTIANAFSVADIRKKLAFTAAMLFLYRLGAYIPAPGVNVNAVKEVSEQLRRLAASSASSTSSRAAASRASVLFALGIMPYITASIILQLLTVVVPSLERLSKEGEVGQQKITQYTRYLTVGLAFGQSLGYVFLFRSLGSQTGTSVVGTLTAAKVFLIVICLTAGCTLLMWLGELITQRGVGNGISLMIFASIASRIPKGINQVVDQPRSGLRRDDAVHRAGGDRRDRLRPGGAAPHPGPVRETGGRAQNDLGRLDLPAAAGQHGRASSRSSSPPRSWPSRRPSASSSTPRPRSNFAAFFSPNGWAYVVGEVFFIIIFTYFYTAVTFNPVDQADNLKKYGGFIPGVRPGRPTAEYLDRILSRLTFPGALYLGAVAALPTILISQTSANFFFGGTSILIVIGVALETVKQLEAQLMMRNYEGFLK